MIKRMTFKQFLFIIPLLVLIGVFALYPIVTSTMYGFFNYRTNNQQTNGFYLKHYFNANLFAENLKYVNYYLSADVQYFDEESAAAAAALMDQNTKYMDQYVDQGTNITISTETTSELEQYVADMQQQVAGWYSAAGEIEYSNQENLDIIMGDLGTSFIKSNFVGGANYQKLVTDSRFYAALQHTLVFTTISVVLEFILGMAMALILDKAIRGIGVIRTASLLPWAIPTAVSAMIWRYLYDGSYGIVAKLFADIGITSSQASMMLTSTGAMSAAIIADVWKTTPYMMLLLLAGLQTIDRGVYESAAIDGSGKVRTFFRITLPLMKSSIMVALLFRTLDAFRIYDLIALLTGGGPANSTETLSVYAYQIMFGQSNYGYGSAIVIGMFVCVAVIAVVFVKLLGADVVGNPESR
ncbi:sugar ABC transporter permease [Ruminococcaceae bacterium OttesenSCG-928-I18]|nr:sugar ABC transporter permease [Ruminococcaceae bacterium OttesenSCG-928-I18]